MSDKASDAIEITGEPMDHGWFPHKPATWKYRYANLKEPLTMQHFKGYWEDGQPAMRDVLYEAGRRVKIVMVSRFGDVGITEHLDADTGYGARVSLEQLTNFGASP